MFCDIDSIQTHCHHLIHAMVSTLNEKLGKLSKLDLHGECNFNSNTGNNPPDADRGVNTRFVLCNDYTLKERQSPLVGTLLQQHLLRTSITPK